MKEKIYGLYDMKDCEQCEFIGTRKEIARYLDIEENTIISYISRHKNGRQKFLKWKFEIIELGE